MKLLRPLSIFLCLSVLLSACDISIDLGSSAPVVNVGINPSAATPTMNLPLGVGGPGEGSEPESTPLGVGGPGEGPITESTPLGVGGPGEGPEPESTPLGVGGPGEGPSCNDSATHTDWTLDGKVYDVNLVNTPMAPNKVFVMAWTIQNTGSCTWDNSYVMSFESGTQMTQGVNFPILQPGQTISLGGSTTVSIEMTAPPTAGEYKAAWRLLSPQGVAVMNFGVTINVGSPQSTSLTRPGDLRYTYDCTSGSMKVSLFWVDTTSGESGYRIYRAGTKVAEIAAGSTTFTEYAPGVGNYKYTVAAFNSGGEASSSVTIYPTNC